jgi:membrane carboxypeptidase/penicillin-binding protein PbpC
VWFIGYTPDIAVGVFIGFDDHAKSIGPKATGSSIALPVFIDFMSEAKKYFTPKPFRVPKGIKLRKINAETGGALSQNSQENITEAFKDEEEEAKEESMEIGGKAASERVGETKGEEEAASDVIDVATEPTKRRSLSRFANEVVDDITLRRKHTDTAMIEDDAPDEVDSPSNSRILSPDEDGNLATDHWNTTEHENVDARSPKINPIFGVY